MTLAASSPARSIVTPLLVLVIGGCVIAAASNGIRNSFGLFTLPLTADLGMSREAWGMAMAIQNLAAMRLFQRGNSPTPAMGGRREMVADGLPLPPPRAQSRGEDGAPSQQPHQQQQGGGAA